MYVVERRRYRRYRPEDLLMPPAAPRGMLVRRAIGDPSLLNLSYGGICFRTQDPLQPGAALPLWVVTPLGMSRVKVRVTWVRRLEAAGCIAGAEYVESSKGWFGPEEDAVAGVDRPAVALVGALDVDEDRPSLE